MDAVIREGTGGAKCILRLRSRFGLIKREESYFSDEWSRSSGTAPSSSRFSLLLA
jgi:hypothetical protein